MQIAGGNVLVVPLRRPSLSNDCLLGEGTKCISPRNNEGGSVEASCDTAKNGEQRIGSGTFPTGESRTSKPSVEAPDLEKVDTDVVAADEMAAGPIPGFVFFEATASPVSPLTFRRPKLNLERGKSLPVAPDAQLDYQYEASNPPSQSEHRSRLRTPGAPPIRRQSLTSSIITPIASGFSEGRNGKVSKPHSDPGHYNREAPNPSTQSELRRRPKATGAQVRRPSIGARIGSNKASNESGFIEARSENKQSEVGKPHIQAPEPDHDYQYEVPNPPSQSELRSSRPKAAAGAPRRRQSIASSSMTPNPFEAGNDKRYEVSKPRSKTPDPGRRYQAPNPSSQTELRRRPKAAVAPVRRPSIGAEVGSPQVQAPEPDHDCRSEVPNPFSQSELRSCRPKAAPGAPRRRQSIGTRASSSATPNPFEAGNIGAQTSSGIAPNASGIIEARNDNLSEVGKPHSQAPEPAQDYQYEVPSTSSFRRVSKGAAGPPPVRRPEVGNPQVQAPEPDHDYQYDDPNPSSQSELRSSRHKAAPSAPRRRQSIGGRASSSATPNPFDAGNIGSQTSSGIAPNAFGVIEARHDNLYEVGKPHSQAPELAQDYQYEVPSMSSQSELRRLSKGAAGPPQRRQSIGTGTSSSMVPNSPHFGEARNDNPFEVGKPQSQQAQGPERHIKPGGGMPRRASISLSFTSLSLRVPNPFDSQKPAYDVHEEGYNDRTSGRSRSCLKDMMSSSSHVSPTRTKNATSSSGLSATSPASPSKNSSSSSVGPMLTSHGTQTRTKNVSSSSVSSSRDSISVSMHGDRVTGSIIEVGPKKRSVSRRSSGFVPGMLMSSFQPERADKKTTPTRKISRRASVSTIVKCGEEGAEFLQLSFIDEETALMQDDQRAPSKQRERPQHNNNNSATRTSRSSMGGQQGNNSSRTQRSFIGIS